MARLLVLALVLGSITSGHARRKKQTPDAMLLEAMDCGKRSCDTLIDAAIDAGADVNKRGAGGQTPLMASVLGGNTNNLKALLKHDPDVTIGEKDGCASSSLPAAIALLAPSPDRAASWHP